MEPTTISEAPQFWTNFKGQERNPNVRDQQHLSNIYWYHAILAGVYHTWVLEILAQHFNGQLLPYQPHISFTSEIEALGWNGNLTWMPLHDGDLIRVGQINHNGAVVGGVAMPLKPGEAAAIRDFYAADVFKKKPGEPQ